MALNRRRVNRLMRSIIADLDLDLRGITVLTEVATGPFVVTPLIAGLAGADRVFAVTRDSIYGTADEVNKLVEGWAGELGIDNKVTPSTCPARDFAAQSNIVTNLGFVRPIDRNLIERLPDDAAIPLMWEPWEYRPDDVDLHACRQRGIPVLGTVETHPRLGVFEYLGMLAVKLLHEADIEVSRAEILLIGSDPFGGFAESGLRAAGAKVNRLALTGDEGVVIRDAVPLLSDADALVLYEHKSRCCLIGEDAGIPAGLIAELGIPVIHICGVVDEAALRKAGVHKVPAKEVKPGYMSVTTGYLGPRPVVDLHAAGLKVGELLVRAMRETGSVLKAENAALASGLACSFDVNRLHREGDLG